MIIPNKDYKCEPVWIYKYRGLLIALATLAILVYARPSLFSLCIGLVFSAAGELLRLWALGWTGEHTRKQSLETPLLVVGGPYKFIRNPLYLGNILTSLGVITAASGRLTWPGTLGMFIFGLSALYFVYASCIISEEAFLAVKFGNVFFDYRGSTPALIPRWRDLAEALNAWGGDGGRVSDRKAHFVFKEDELESEPQPAAAADPHFQRANLKFEISSLIWLAVIWSYLAVSVFCR
ncbi:isoprenylcysteine carboxylmethyltransferase family protein [bacterium]|nr:isoprenylcysteine carboxylmethyltransferase family protein [bacterium]